MREAGVPPPEVERSMKLITSREFAKSVRTAPEPTVIPKSVDQEELTVEHESSYQELESLAKKRKDKLHTVYSAGRSELLGGDPRAVRAELRSKLETGYYLSETGRKGTLILHRFNARASQSLGWII